MSLEDFIKRESIGQLDSTGEFSFDHLEAIKKLGKSALVGPADYLLRVLKAGLHYSRRFKCKLSLNEVVVDFHFKHDESISPPVLLEALDGKREWPSPAARQLGLGMLAALREGETVTWEFAGNELSLGSRFCCQVNEQALPDVKASFRVKYPTVAWWDIKKRVRRLKTVTMEAQSWLTKHCRFSDFEISVDGKELGSPWDIGPLPKGRANWSRAKFRPYCLLQSYVHGYDLPLFDFPRMNLEDYKRQAGGIFRWMFFYQDDDRPGVNLIPSGYRKESPPTLFVAFSAAFEGQKDFVRTTCGAAFALDLRMEGPARVWFRVDGLTSHPKEVDLGVPGLQCLLSGEGLATDLSELKIVENEAYQRRMIALSEAVKSFRAQLHELRENFLPLVKEISWTNSSTTERMGQEIEHRLQPLWRDLEHKA